MTSCFLKNTIQLYLCLNSGKHSFRDYLSFSSDFFLNNHEKTLFVACSHTCAVRFPIYPQISYFFFIILYLTHSIFWAIEMSQEQARAPLIENRVRHVSPIIKVLMSNWTIIGMFRPSSHSIFCSIMLISPFLIALYFILVTMCFIFAFTNNAMAGSMSFLFPCKEMTATSF